MTKRCHELDPNVKIVFLTAYDAQENNVERAIKAGVPGFSPSRSRSPSSWQRFVTSTKVTNIFHDALKNSLSKSDFDDGENDGAVTRLDPLSKREIEVLRCVAMGMTTKQIATKSKMTLKLFSWLRSSYCYSTQGSSNHDPPSHRPPSMKRTARTPSVPRVPPPARACAQ